MFDKNIFSQISEQEALINQLSSSLKEAREYLALLSKSLPTEAEIEEAIDNGDIKFREGIEILSKIKVKRAREGSATSVTTAADFLVRFPDGVSKIYQNQDYVLTSDGKFFYVGGVQFTSPTAAAMYVRQQYGISSNVSGNQFWGI